MALSDDLEKFITDRLENYQSTKLTTGIAADIADLAVNPTNNPYKQLSFVNGRMNTIADRLLNEQAAGTVAPWVVPSVAAAAFEGIFETCVAFWISQNQPPNGAALKAQVQSFVKWQVRAFTWLVTKQ